MRIVFFNHFHRGDLNITKEYVKQIMQELPHFKFQYLHPSPRKITDEFPIDYGGSPINLNHKSFFYRDNETNTLYINTWQGVDWDIFCNNGGCNMYTLYALWGKIFNAINKVFGVNLQLKSKEEYLPKFDYSKIKTDHIDNFLSDKKNIVLICNNRPMSNQSFIGNMQDILNYFAFTFPEYNLILTDPIETKFKNIFFTSDITKTNGETDLIEISYISTKAKGIAGKNSGPFVFCETYDNYMDPNKVFVSFNKHSDDSVVKETMSLDLIFKCKYFPVPIKTLNSNPTDDIDLPEDEKKLVVENMRNLFK